MGDIMKKCLMLGIGIIVGMMLSQCECMKKPMQPVKQMMKKINIE